MSSNMSDTGFDLGSALILTLYFGFFGILVFGVLGGGAATGTARMPRELRSA